MLDSEALLLTTEQLPLFESARAENPLKTRFESVFFKNIPTSPGVYWMSDQHGLLLYVGKAKDLRARLRSYRNTSLEKHDSKTRRLLMRVTKIEWDVLESEEAACLRENELLRGLKPPFNVANTKPENYIYLSYRLHPDGIWISRHFHLRECETGDRIHGAFRGIPRVLKTHSALARFFWAFSRYECDWPAPLLRNVAPGRVFIPFDSEDRLFLAGAMIESFLNGDAEFDDFVLPQDEPLLYLQKIWARDSILLKTFFARAARSLRNLKAAMGHASYIDQQDLDDLMVRRRFQSLRP